MSEGFQGRDLTVGEAARVGGAATDEGLVPPVIPDLLSKAGADRPVGPTFVVVTFVLLGFRLVGVEERLGTGFGCEAGTLEARDGVDDLVGTVDREGVVEREAGLDDAGTGLAGTVLDGRMGREVGVEGREGRVECVERVVRPVGVAGLEDGGPPDEDGLRVVVRLCDEVVRDGGLLPVLPLKGGS